MVFPYLESSFSETASLWEGGPVLGSSEPALACGPYGEDLFPSMCSHTGHLVQYGLTGTQRSSIMGTHMD